MNSETEPERISLALCLGMVMGLTPFLSLHNILVLFLVFIIRVNFSSFLAGYGFFAAIAYIFDPLFHSFGLKMLKAGPLEGFWTAMYNSAFWRIEGFNNTVRMGGLFVSLLMFVPLFFVFNRLIVKYREHVLRWVMKTRLMKAFTASSLYRAYSKVSGMRDAI